MFNFGGIDVMVDANNEAADSIRVYMPAVFYVVAVEFAGWDGDAKRGLSRGGAEGEAPGVPAEFEGEVESVRDGCGTIVVVGR
jgi:hypothetical protein